MIRLRRQRSIGKRACASALRGCWPRFCWPSGRRGRPVGRSRRPSLPRTSGGVGRGLPLQLRGSGLRGRRHVHRRRGTGVPVGHRRAGELPGVRLAAPSGDLAISGPGLLTGLTGLPSPPPYPFYESSRHPTTPEAKVGQPGYELAATSAESTSKDSTMTGGGSGSEANASSLGKTVTGAEASRDAASGTVTAVVAGRAHVINVGGVLRVGQVDVNVKVVRAPGTDPAREGQFRHQRRGYRRPGGRLFGSGFTFDRTNVPIPQGKRDGGAEVGQDQCRVPGPERQVRRRGEPAGHPAGAGHPRRADDGVPVRVRPAGGVRDGIGQPDLDSSRRSPRPRQPRRRCSPPSIRSSRTPMRSSLRTRHRSRS